MVPDLEIRDAGDDGGPIPPREPVHVLLRRAMSGMPAVKVRGEAPSAVWWRGSQWAVTAYGLEALDGTYAIKADRLGERWPPKAGEPLWIHHMARKGWVDLADFVAAFLVALALHGRARSFRPADLRSLVAGRRPKPAARRAAARVLAEQAPAELGKAGQR